MLFNSVQFWVFFAVVSGLYFGTPHRWRWVLLLVASYAFYMCWSVKYILVIWGITLLDYWVAIRIEAACGARRRAWLALSMAGNFGLLGLFKYADFFAGHAWLGWALPVGISFHTFQAVSYTFDVYAGKVRAERQLGIYALYVAFFPQMVAGPIERAGGMMPQFHRELRLDWQRVFSGLRLALWGMLKKAVVADVAAPVVNAVYGEPHGYGGPMLLLATFLFSIQIYCDFSGYSDIAIGTARILGFDLTVNFRQPYLAASPVEFWRRWHISLSTWFRDYLYIPLGGSRCGMWRYVVNVLVVFVLSGLWHGANWTFAVWGLLHGVYLLLWKPLASLPVAVRVLLTNVMVGFAWIFFRARTLDDGLYIVTHLFGAGKISADALDRIGLPRFEAAVLAVSILTILGVEHYWAAWRPQSRAVRWAVYAAAVYAVIFLGVFGKREFIYFQF